MAKKVKGATITFEVTDDGTLKQVGQKAKQAKKGLDQTSKSAGDVRRNMQAMSGRVESGSKAFARMQQGTGGLVQSYAVLASTLFALGAAFRVMQNAADFQALQASQEAYASQTGVNMAQVSRDLQMATKGQIDLQKAGASAAIMIAKGFSTEQIEQVATASTQAALALGRNFEDTFNRIVQGTTKAEPELLDELGITLRLETASRRYAQAIGKNYQELTTFEKSQAVLNETLRQANDNFGALGNSVPVNQLNQLATTFSDLMQTILGVISPLANFIATVLNKNIVAAIAVLGLFAKSMGGEILGALGIDFEMFGAKIESINDRLASSTEQSTSRIRAAFSSATMGPEAAAMDTRKTAKKLARGSKSPVLKRAAKGTMAGADSSNLAKALRSAEMQYQRHGKIVTGIFKGKDIAVVRSLELSFAKQKMTMKGFQGFAARTAGFIQGSFTMAFNGIKFAGGKMIGFLTVGLTKLGSVANKIMGKAGMIGIIILVIQGLMSLIQNFNGIMASITNGVAGLAQSLANFLTTGIGRFLPGSQAMAKGLEGVARKLENSAEGFAETQSLITETKDKMDAFKESADETRKKLRLLNEQIMEGAIGYDGTANSTVILSKRLGTSGLLGDVQKLNSIYKLANAEVKNSQQQGIKDANIKILQSDQYKMSQKATANLLAEYQRMIPELRGFTVESLQNVENMEEFEAIVTKFTSKGNLPGYLKQATENMENLRKSYATAALGDGFAQQATQLKTTVAELGKFGEKTIINKKFITEIAQQLGVSEKKMKQLMEEAAELRGETAGTAVNIQSVVFGTQHMVTDISEAVHQTKMLNAQIVNANKVLGQFNTRNNKFAQIENKILGLKKQINQQLMLDEYERSQAIKNLEEMTVGERQLTEVQAQRIQDRMTELELLENQIDVVHRIGKAFTEAFDNAGTKALSDLLMGTKEAFQAVDAVRMAMKKAVADEISGAIMQPITKRLQGLLQQARSAITGQEIEKSPEERMEIALTTHVTDLEKVLLNHAAAFDRNMAATQQNTVENNEKKKADEKTGKTIGAKMEEVVTTGTNTSGTGFSAIFGDLGKTIDTFSGNLMGVLKGDGTGLFGKGEGGANSLFGDLFADIFGEGGMMKNFMSNLMGEGGIGGALQGLLGGGGTGGLLGGLMGGSGGGLLGGLLGGGGGGGIMALLKPLLGMIPGIGPLLSILPFAKGGIIGNKLIPLASGGVMPRYAKGGVATQPTYLVGEGKQNEAVVPLPDNRSIPVDLGTGAGDTNNTNINVNIDNSGESADVTAEGSKQLAEAINASVMATIMKEKAPGGVLNPTG